MQTSGPDAIVWWKSRRFKKRFHRVTSHMTWFIGSHGKKSAPVGSVSVDLNWTLLCRGKQEDQGNHHPMPQISHNTKVPSPKSKRSRVSRSRIPRFPKIQKIQYRQQKQGKRATAGILFADPRGSMTDVRWRPGKCLLDSSTDWCGCICIKLFWTRSLSRSGT